VTRLLELHAHPGAALRIRDRGFKPELFSSLIGASGGPKWLVLSQLDRVLFPWLLNAQRSTPLVTVGSSIGAWRLACFASGDPVGAIERLERGYIEQQYAQRPSTDEISSVSSGIIEHALGDHGATNLVNHPLIRTHIITVSGRGGWNAQSTPRLALACAKSAIANALSRKHLGRFVTRFCFHSDSAPLLRIDDQLATVFQALTPNMVTRVVRASGSIPLLMAGVPAMDGEELHWDGGITDYHFSDRFRHHDGLTLYPHFFSQLTPGWFDKSLAWRRQTAARWPGLVLLCPSAEFVRRLPFQRIPSRKDFETLSTADRIVAWWKVVDLSRYLADECQQLLEGRGLEERLS